MCSAEESSTNSISLGEETPPPLLVFDGGTGREIERLGGPFRQPEWSALALYEDPSVVRRVHESYYEAGASAVTTNSYAIVPFHLGSERYQRDSKYLLDLSVDLAQQARDNVIAKWTTGGNKGNDNNHNIRINSRQLFIIGSIPPICGSYEPDKFDRAVAEPILQDFLNAYRNKVDILLLETIGSIEEAEFYLTIIREEFTNHKWDLSSKPSPVVEETTSNKAVFSSAISPSSSSSIPIWLSFCVASDYGMEQSPRLLSGESIQGAIHHLFSKGLLRNDLTPVILVNCCDMRLVTDSLKEIKLCLSNISSTFSSSDNIDPTEQTKKDAIKHHSNNKVFQIGAYPNAFSIPPPDSANHTLRNVNYNITPKVFQSICYNEWILSCGATVVGGCCGIGPEHIHAIATLKTKT